MTDVNPAHLKTQPLVQRNRVVNAIGVGVSGIVDVVRSKRSRETEEPQVLKNDLARVLKIARRDDVTRHGGLSLALATRGPIVPKVAVRTPSASTTIARKSRSISTTTSNTTPDTFSSTSLKTAVPAANATNAATTAAATAKSASTSSVIPPGATLSTKLVGSTRMKTGLVSTNLPPTHPPVSTLKKKYDSRTLTPLATRAVVVEPHPVVVKPHLMPIAQSENISNALKVTRDVGVKAAGSTPAIPKRAVPSVPKRAIPSPRDDPFASGKMRIPVSAPSPPPIRLPSFANVNGTTQLTMKTANTSAPPDIREIDQRAASTAASCKMDPMASPSELDKLPPTRASLFVSRFVAAPTPASNATSKVAGKNYSTVGTAAKTTAQASLSPGTVIQTSSDTIAPTCHKRKRTSDPRSDTERNHHSISTTTLNVATAAARNAATGDADMPALEEDDCEGVEDANRKVRVVSPGTTSASATMSKQRKEETEIVMLGVANPSQRAVASSLCVTPLTTARPVTLGRSGLPAFVTPTAFANIKRATGAGSVRFALPSPLHHHPPPRVPANGSGGIRASVQGATKPRSLATSNSSAGRSNSAGHSNSDGHKRATLATTDAGTFVPYHSEDCNSTSVRVDGVGKKEEGNVYGGGGGGGDDDGDDDGWGWTVEENDEGENGCVDWTLKRTAVAPPKEILDDDVLEDDIRHGREYRVDPVVYAVSRHAEAKNSDIPHLRPRLTGIALQRYLASMAAPLSQKPIVAPPPPPKPVPSQPPPLPLPPPPPKPISPLPSLAITPVFIAASGLKQQVLASNKNVTSPVVNVAANIAAADATKEHVTVAAAAAAAANATKEKVVTAAAEAANGLTQADKNANVVLPKAVGGGEKHVEMMIHEVQEHKGHLHVFGIAHTPVTAPAALQKKKGASVSIKLDFQPWFFVDRPKNWDARKLTYFQRQLNKMLIAASPFAGSFGRKRKKSRRNRGGGGWGDDGGFGGGDGRGVDRDENENDDDDDDDGEDGDSSGGDNGLDDGASGASKNAKKTKRTHPITCAYESRQRLIGFDFERLTPLIRVTCADLYTFRTTVTLFDKAIHNYDQAVPVHEPRTFIRYNHDCPFRQMFFSASGTVMYGTVAVPLRNFLDAADSVDKAEEAQRKRAGWKPNGSNNNNSNSATKVPFQKFRVEDVKHGQGGRGRGGRGDPNGSKWERSKAMDVGDARGRGGGSGGGGNEKNVTTALDKHRTTCQIQVALDWRILVPVKHKQTIAPLLKLSFDIETVTGSKLGGFPKAARPHDMINYISNHFYWHGEATPFLSVLMCLGEIDAAVRTLEGHPNGVVVLQYSNERDMLLAWHEMAMRRCDVDELVTYNGLFYDELWLLDRAKMLGISQVTSRMSKFCDFAVEAKKIQTTSNQSGDRVEYRIKMPGRTQFDVLKVVLREKKTLSSYQLKDVAPVLIKFEGASEEEKRASRERYNKIDLPYNLLRPYFLLGPQKRTEIAIYCLRDSEITYRLAHDQQFFGNYYQMARLTQTQNNDLITAGETTKVMSMLWGHIQSENWALNKDELTRLRAAHPVTYIGATVLKPKPGLYTHPIATFDFGSLYPSIMCAENTCYSTILFDPVKIAEARAAGYWVEEHLVQAKNNPHFVRGVRALLPAALKELLAKRKEAKNEMEAAFLAGDYALVAIFNGKQGAIKISANSVYGFCGADGSSAKAEKKRAQAKEAGQTEKPAMAGPLPLVAIASAVTTKGRAMIRATRAVFVADGHTVIYGDTDSVMVDLLEAHEHEYGDMTDAKTVKAEDLRALDRLIAICVEYSRKISATFTKPNVLNFEKIAPVFLLIAKKTYAAIVWEYKSLKAGAPEQAVIKGIDFKGVSCVRRDWCPFSRKLGEKMLNMVLKRRSLDEILGVFQQHVDMMVDDKVPLKDYLLTKKLKALYGTKPPIHKEVALKMAERDPELAPPVGTRIQYVVCNNGETEFSKQGEEFDYALKTNMKPDLNYYFDKQLLKPILRTLITVDRDIENMLMQTADHRLRAKMSPKKDVFAHFIHQKFAPSSSSSASSSSPLSSFTSSTSSVPSSPSSSLSSPSSSATTATSKSTNTRNVQVNSSSQRNGASGSVRDVGVQKSKTKAATSGVSATVPLPVQEIRVVCPKPRQLNSSQQHQQQQHQQQQQQQSQKMGSSAARTNVTNGVSIQSTTSKVASLIGTQTEAKPLSLRALFQQNRLVAVANAKRAGSQALPPSDKMSINNVKTSAIGNTNTVAKPNAGTNNNHNNNINKLHNTQGAHPQTKNDAVATQKAGKPRFAISAIASTTDVHPFFAGF